MSGGYDLFLGGVGFLALAGSGAVAIPAWLTDRPDSSARMRLRLISCLTLLGAVLLLSTAQHHGSWWGSLWAFFLTFYLLSRCSHWFKAMETYRRAERAPTPRTKNRWTP